LKYWFTRKIAIFASESKDTTMIANTDINSTATPQGPLLRDVETISFARIRQETTAPPCQYTVEEMRRRLDHSMESLRAGDVVSLEALRARHPRA
jgi:ribonuclease BN (tRNA processing enzyme)